MGDRLEGRKRREEEEEKRKRSIGRRGGDRSEERGMEEGRKGRR